MERTLPETISLDTRTAALTVLHVDITSLEMEMDRVRLKRRIKLKIGNLYAER
jgi:hypothetical protein